MTWVGSMSVERTSRKTTFRPRQSMREKAYATGMHETTTPTVERPAYRNVFQVYRAKLMLLNTSWKFESCTGLGIRRAVSACWSVITAVRSMKSTGSAKARATAISMAWFAIDIRSRRRRTCGGRRRVAAAEATTGLPGSAPSASTSRAGPP